MSAAPRHLAVFLSGNCNFSCTYCRARFPGAPAPRRVLLKALGKFLAACPGEPKLSFLGGEPLLHPGLLKAAVSLVRRRSPGARMQLFTNGSLLTPALGRFLAASGVKIVLSADGDAGVNDRCRRFAAGRRSALAAALKGAGAAGCRSANLVVTPASAAKLDESLDFLRGRGFTSLSWAPDAGAGWDRAVLRALGKAAARAAANYLSALRAGEAPYEIANIYEVLCAASERRGLTACSSLTLAPDGNFYPCDKLLARGPRGLERYRTDPGGGGRERFFREAAAAGFRPREALCPVGPWITARVCGRGGKAFLNGQARARALFVRWLGLMAREGAKHPAFRRLHGLSAGSCARRKGRAYGK